MSECIDALSLTISKGFTRQYKDFKAGLNKGLEHDLPQWIHICLGYQQTINPYTIEPRWILNLFRMCLLDNFRRGSLNTPSESRGELRKILGKLTQHGEGPGGIYNKVSGLHAKA